VRYSATELDADHGMRELRYVTSAVRDVQLYRSFEVPQHSCAVEAFDPGCIQSRSERSRQR